MKRLIVIASHNHMAPGVQSTLEFIAGKQKNVKAIDAYTEGSAYMEFMEGKKGRIKPGQLADIVVLDKDIFTCDPMEIRDILPVMTMIDGKIVYKK